MEYYICNMTTLKTSLLSLAISLILFSCGEEKKPSPPPAANPDVLKTLQESVKKYPDSLYLVHELIEVYRNEGYYDSALAVTSREIAKDSGNAYLWNIKATLNFENEDTLQAISALEHAIAIYPLPEYLVALGTIYAEIKSRNAIVIADEILAMQKEKFVKDAYFIKGLYYNFDNKPDSAIIFLDKNLKLDFSYMYAYREKAIALSKLKRYQEAIQVLQRAVTIRNNYDEGYFWLGHIYEKVNDTANAVISYQNALLYDPNYTEAKEALRKISP